jgi:hypothetical protein
MFFEGIEIPVVVKQRKAPLDAECCDPAVDDFTYGKPLATKFPIVHCALQGKVPPVRHLYLAKAARPAI